jgi:branched-chain amino acid transport system permease protein
VPTVLLNADRYTKGTNGIGGLYQPALPGYQFQFIDGWPYFLTMALIVTLVIVAIQRLEQSRLGRAWMAVREDEVAAASSGVNPITTKLLAFALGASTAGLGGVFFAGKLSYVSPDQFGFTVSFTVVLMVVVGGMGNVWGAAAGAFLLFTIETVIVKQLDSFLTTLGFTRIDLLPYQYALYGLVLVAMVLLRPEGLIPAGRGRRDRGPAAAALAEPAANDVPPFEAVPVAEPFVAAVEPVAPGD